MTQQLSIQTSDLAPDLSSTATGKPIAGLWRLTRGFRVLLLGVLLSMGIAVVARTGTYLVIRYFVDDFLVDPAASLGLWLIAGAFLALTFVQGAFGFLSGALAARSSEGIVQRLRNYLLNHIQRLPFAYHDSTQTGELIQRATSDVDAVRRLFAVEVVASGRIIFLFLVNFIAIMFLDVQLALISVIVIPFVLALSVYFFRLVSRAYDAYQEQDAVLTTTLQENLTGVRVVKAFARQQYEEAKFEDTNNVKYQRGKRLLLMHSLVLAPVRHHVRYSNARGTDRRRRDGDQRHDNGGYVHRLRGNGDAHHLAYAQPGPVGGGNVARARVVWPPCGGDSRAGRTN